MKLTKLAVLMALLLGMSAPVFAAIPTVEEAQEAVAQQPQPEDPKAENAQKAFVLAITALTETQDHPNLAKLQAILEKEDFQESLEKSILDANIRLGDPKAAEKMLNAYANNKYIKELVDILISSQTEYTEKELDRNVLTLLLLQSFLYASIVE